MRKLTVIAALCLLTATALAQVNPVAIIIRLIFRGRGQQPRPLAIHRVVHPDQKAELPKVEPVSATQKCENWAWAAGLETSLRLQGISNLPQNYWVMKANGGEVCDDRPVDLQKIAKLIDGKYTLDDGRKVLLESSTIMGVPTAVDPLIVATRAGRPLVFLWKGHPYIYVGMNYHEVVWATGQRDYEVQEMKLLDPIAAPEKQAVAFNPVNDDPAEINGLLDIKATLIEPQSWLHPEKELLNPQEIYFPKK
ncbi:MAG: hypothetical protein L0Z53_14125 [Acidobacteriales bacterium]|nr:hypothetical protein [Terriglobales bacterium]